MYGRYLTVTYAANKKVPKSRAIQRKTQRYIHILVFGDMSEPHTEYFF